MAPAEVCGGFESDGLGVSDGLDGSRGGEVGSEIRILKGRMKNGTDGTDGTDGIAA